MIEIIFFSVIRQIIIDFENIKKKALKIKG